MATANCNESHSTGYKCNRARRSVPHLSPLHVGRRAETLLPRPINSFITALLLRKSPPRIITSPVISPLFSYARDNGYVANHSCASIDHTVSLSRLFPSPFFETFDSTRFESRCSREIQIFPAFHLGYQACIRYIIRNATISPKREDR